MHDSPILLPPFAVSATRGRGATSILPAARAGVHEVVGEPFAADLYVNLNLTPGPGNRVYSLRSREGGDRGKIRCYCNAVLMRGATFMVQEGGRLDVIANQCKQVHAWVRGEVLAVGRDALAYLDSNAAEQGVLVGYDPYRTSGFVVLPAGAARLPADVTGLRAIEHAPVVIALPGGVVAFERASPPPR